MDVVKEHAENLILGFGLEDEDAHLEAMALRGTPNLQAVSLQLGSGLEIPSATKLAMSIQSSPELVHLDLEGPGRMITSPRASAKRNHVPRSRFEGSFR